MGQSDLTLGSFVWRISTPYSLQCFLSGFFPLQPPPFLAPLPPLIVSIWALSHSKVASNVQTSPHWAWKLEFWVISPGTSKSLGKLGDSPIYCSRWCKSWQHQNSHCDGFSMAVCWGPNKQPSGQNSALAEHTWQICSSHEHQCLIDKKSIN